MTDKYKTLRGVAQLRATFEKLDLMPGYLAAADPKTILGLLAELDALRSVLARCITRIKTDRDELELCAIDPRTGTVTDQATRDAIAEYDTLLAASVAALAQHQGEKHVEGA